MIEPAREDEMEDVCNQIASISPWTDLAVSGGQLLHGPKLDPLREMLVLRESADQPPAGAIVVRHRSAAELLFFRGFAPALAERHGVAYPCEWTDVPDAGYIGSLAVFPGYTGRGLGQQLIDAAHELFRASGHTLCYLMVSGFNADARRFYERNGYRAVTHLDDCIRPGNREYLMEKTVDSV
jgi:ribosomal protein S18 acetylase RimI-like enzyme